MKMARKIIFGDIDLDYLKDFAKKLQATHCMFATSEFFKNLYGVEYSVWCSSMPMSEYNSMCEIYGIRPLPDLPDPSEVSVERFTVRDLPDTEECKVSMIRSGTVLSGVVSGCIGCGSCTEECPERAISIKETSEGFVAEIESDRCAGTACRRCERACPERVLNTLALRV